MYSGNLRSRWSHLSVHALHELWILKGGQELDQKDLVCIIIKEFRPFSGMQSTDQCEVGHSRLFVV